MASTSAVDRREAKRAARGSRAGSARSTRATAGHPRWRCEPPALAAATACSHPRAALLCRSQSSRCTTTTRRACTRRSDSQTGGRGTRRRRGCCRPRRQQALARSRQAGERGLETRGLGDRWRRRRSGTNLQLPECPRPRETMTTCARYHRLRRYSLLSLCISGTVCWGSLFPRGLILVFDHERRSAILTSPHHTWLSNVDTAPHSSAVVCAVLPALGTL